MKIKSLIQFTTAAALLPFAASAATIVWNGTGDDWTDGLNWGGTAPTDDTTTDIAQLTGGSVTLDADRSVNGLDVNLASTLTGSGTRLILGGGGLSGSADLTLDGNILRASSVSTYTGNITVDGAVIEVNNGSNGILGTGIITLDNGGAIVGYSSHLQMGSTSSIVLGSGGGTISNAHGYALYGMSGVVISGAGQLTLDGVGSTHRSSRIQLQGSTNTYTGGTLVSNKANVQINGDANFGATTGKVTIDDARIVSWGVTYDAAREFEIASGGGRISLAEQQSVINGALSGSGALTIDGQNRDSNDATPSGTLVLNGDGSGFTGNVLIDSASVRYTSAGQLGSGVVTLDNGGEIYGANHIDMSGNTSIILGAGGGTIRHRHARNVNGLAGVVISGSGALTLAGESSSGNIRMQGTNTYTGGTIFEDGGYAYVTSNAALGDAAGSITFSGGILQNFDSVLQLGNRAIIVDADGGSIKAGWGKDVTAEGVVSGSGDLEILSDSGTVHLTNSANTFSGNLIVGSSLRLGSLGGGSYAGVISGAGDVALDLSGDQTLTGTNTNTGALTISGGTVDLGGGTADGSLANPTLNLDNGSLAYTRTGGTTQAFTTTNIVSGSTEISTVAGNTLSLGALNRTAGGLSIGTDGTITTSTANDASGILGGWASYGDDWAVANGGSGITAYSGYTTTSSAGTSAANYASNHIDVDSSEGTIDAVITPNTLRFNTAAAHTLTLAAGTNVINSGGILVGSNVGNNLSTITGGDLTGAASSDLIITQNNTSNDLTISSVIADNSGTNLIKSGDGTVNLATAATYTGETIVGAGKLVIQNGVASDNFTVNSGSTLEFNTGSGNQILSTGTITGGGTFVKSGSNDLSLGASGQVQNMSMSGGGLIHVQGGRLRNDYGNGNWDDNLASLTIDSGASVDLWDSPGGITVDALNGAGNITRYRYGPSSTNVTVGVNGGSGTFSGVISDDTNYNKYVALVKEGAGEQVLSGANTFHGTTTVSDGTLTLSNSLALQNSVLDTTSSISGDASNGLKTTVTTLTVGGLIGDKDLASVFTTTSGGYDGVTALTLNPNADEHGTHTYSGVIADGAAGMTLTKAGSGTQILSGNNTYTGSTTVSAGTLQLLGDITSDDLSVASGATLEIDTTAGDQQLNGGTISGDGTLVKSGTGLLMFGANGSTQFISMSGGLIDVQAGTLRNEYGKGDWSANLSSLNIESGATVNTWDGGDIRVDALTGAGTVTHTNYGSATSLVVGVNGGSGTFTGLLTDDGSKVLGLVKEGAGTQILTGNNDYQGTTTINLGTLQIGDGGTSGSLGTGDVVNDGVLVFNRSNTYGVGNNISGTGSLELTAQSGAESSLTGTNTYSGGTTINSGRFRVANDGNLGDTSGALTLNGGGLKNNGGALTLDAARNVIIGASGGQMQAGWTSALEVAGVVSGSGDLTIEGDSGTVVLSNVANTYSGQINLQDANSRLSVESLGAGATVVGDAAAIFTYTGDADFDGAQAFFGTTVIADGATVTGSGSLAGDLTLESGSKFIFSAGETLSVSGDVSLFSGFGVDDIQGLSSATAVGTYVLIDTTSSDFSGLDNFGAGNAFDLGDGISAYFQNGSLELVVVPEPGTFALLAGMLALGSVMIRRRRA